MTGDQDIAPMDCILQHGLYPTLDYSTLPQILTRGGPGRRSDGWSFVASRCGWYVARYGSPSDSRQLHSPAAMVFLVCHDNLGVEPEQSVGAQKWLSNRRLPRILPSIPPQDRLGLPRKTSVALVEGHEHVEHPI